jgi:hypothetical protein
VSDYALLLNDQNVSQPLNVNLTRRARSDTIEPLGQDFHEIAVEAMR